MAKTATDDAGKQAALDVLGELYYPYHNMVWGWHDAFYPYGKPQWNPDHNLDDMVIQEMTDAQKSLQYIKGLEAKLKGKNQGEVGTGLDWEMLSRMKKELGLPVDYKTETEKREEKRAGDAGYTPDPLQKALTLQAQKNSTSVAAPKK